MASYMFQPIVADQDTRARSAGSAGMGVELLLHDACWFTRIRWVVVLVLFGMGVLGELWPESIAARLGVVQPRCCWPFILAGLLAFLNLVTLGWLARINGHTSNTAVAANLWFQIVCDLAVLTVLAYFMGLTDTPIAFAFLFHIVLACIFFGRRDSFLVTLLSAVLFISAVVLVEMGLLPRCSVLKLGHCCTVTVVIHAGFAVFVWFVVWYLASSISDMVRRRDFELASANARLRQADGEKNRQMLRVTHDLKAPFSGIESFIQVLRHVHWDSLPEGSQRIIEKIEARSAMLRERIGEILTLGSLRSGHVSGKSQQSVSLSALLAGVVEELKGLASQKQVSVALKAPQIFVTSDPRQLNILFMNLIANAISYSQDGGEVEVSLRDGKYVCIEVRDHGIGIRADALPHVFEDFYRSKEAANFNRKSTGLGLAAVRQVADNLSLSIEIESEEGVGTLFRVRIPRSPASH